MVYLTTQEKKPLPTHVKINSSKYPSTVLCEQIDTVNKDKVGDYIGQCSMAEMKKIDAALAVSIGIGINIKSNDLVKKWAEAANEAVNGAICDEGGCFDGGRVYFDKDGVDQEGEERANWIDARWCDGMNRDGLPATWTYETEVPCERFDIWEDGEVYCVGLVFSIEDLK